MNLIEEAIATLGIPGSIAVGLLIVFAALQLVGEFIEAIGKVAPAALKLRKVFTRRIKRKREEQRETSETLKEVKALLAEVNSHYSADNITMRNEWMTWVNTKADYYDTKVEELIELKGSLDAIATALAENTKTTDEMFKESCRDRIINFASKVTNPLNLVSHEEFRRIFKVYDAYEAFLEAHNEPNGEVETNYALIREAYADRVRSHNFIEDIIIL